jgi:predicted  nucleic acid-binding Zn-ribbon protein
VVQRVSRRRGLGSAIGVAVAAVAALVVLSGRPVVALAAAEDLCAADSGWAVIADSSNATASATGFLCNYRVDRTTTTLTDGRVVNLGQSGVAITIEYYCSAAEGRDRYQSVAGARTTETFRDDAAGVLITEEGTQAKNPDNPQAQGVFSGFFVDSNGDPIPFGLQEKEWRLLNPQVFATIVVLTNERGKVDETERFGVEQGEIVARDLANRSRSAAGCDIPEVGGTTTSTGDGGGLPVTVLGGAVGTAIVVVGGYTIWRRRKGAVGRAAPKIAPKVPPQCQGLATIYDDQVQTLATLGEAQADLQKQLDRAEKIHKNNLIKARMVVNLEIISALGQSATDIALALRPAVLRRVGPGAIGQMDTWKPPGSLSAKWADRIRAAEEAARNAWSRFHQLTEEASLLLSPIEERIRQIPAVQNAKQMWEFHMNRLGEMMADLPKVNQLRTELTQLEHGVEVASGEMKAAEGVLTKAKSELSAAETALNMERNQLPPGYWAAQKELEGAEERMAKLVSTGVEDTLRLGRAQEAIDAARGRLSSATREAGDTVSRITDLEKAMTDASARVDVAKEPFETAGKAYDKAVGDRQKVSNTLLTQYSDLTAADIDSQGKVAAQAQREYDAAQAQGRQALSEDLLKKREQANAAQVDAAAAQGQLDDVRAQAEADTVRSAMGTPTDKGGIVSAIGKAIWWASAPVRYSLTIAGELVLGVGQSPQEIMEILLQGRTNIQLLRSHLGAVSRARFDQQRKLRALRNQLTDCVKGPLKGVDLPADAEAKAA